MKKKKIGECKQAKMVETLTKHLKILKYKKREK